ncbi:hypothetical protein TNCV_1325691 [Trichonephila clavipes]|nr:hypothetical protein TNCV_1325691 [Trichonephila clavipes]
MAMLDNRMRVTRLVVDTEESASKFNLKSNRIQTEQTPSMGGLRPEAKTTPPIGIDNLYPRFYEQRMPLKARVSGEEVILVPYRKSHPDKGVTFAN